MADKEKAKALGEPTAPAATPNANPEGEDTVEDPTSRLDVTIPGGCYVMGDRVVDANGKALEGWSVDRKGNAIPPKLKPTQAKDDI